jgi:hypothetical protein
MCMPTCILNLPRWGAWSGLVQQVRCMISPMSLADLTLIVSGAADCQQPLAVYASFCWAVVQLCAGLQQH